MEFNKDTLLTLLKDNLEINVKENNEYGYKTVDIEIHFAGEKVCSDSVYISGDAQQI